MSTPAPKPGLGTRLLTRFFGSAVSNAAGYAVGGAVLPTLEPFTQDLANQTWAAHSVKPLPANAAANAVLRGYLTDEEGTGEANYTGFDAGRFATMLRLNGDVPPLEMLLDLHRRGTIDDPQLNAGIRQAGILPEWRQRLRARLDVLPSVTDMVRFAVREVYDPAQRAALDLDAEFPPAFATDAKTIGITRELAGRFWASHWQLPSYEQMTEMLFRGEITHDQYVRGLRALDYAPVWRGPLEAISRRIPTVTDMVRFAVREVYNPPLRKQLGYEEEYPPAFTAQAAMHGLSEEHARQYWWAHWRLPSAQQGYRMLWRGEIDQDELDALLKALDYPKPWRSRLSNIAHLVPGRIDLKRMLRHGIKTEAEVTAGYIKLGYTPADAALMTQIAVAELPHGGPEAQWAPRARTRLFTVAHNEFMDRSIDEAEARTVLTMLGAGAAEQTTVLALWEKELEIQRLELTPTQIKKAYSKGQYDLATATSELIERGLTPEDADTLLKS